MILELFLIVAPIFLMIVLGHGLRRGGIPSFEFWNLNDKLVYWLLFPALLFEKTSTMDVSGELLSDFFFVIYPGFAVAFAFSILIGSMLRFDRPILTSILQGSARHNTFIALAVAERIYGPQGLADATLIAAILVPITNITVVSSLVTLLRKEEEGGLFGAIIRDVSQNPFLIAIALGLLVNYLGLGPLPVINEVCQILGAAALPIVLLCVGANIRVRAMVVSAPATVVAIIGKMVLFPLVIVLVAKSIGMDTTSAMVAVVFGAVPTAAGSYTLARAMGGDAPAMAAIVTLQTALAFFSLPATLLLADYILKL
ncbi:MAG: AEC family transporter [Filomicrobium sp.]